MNLIGHNPYFNRWFSAILLADSDITTVEKVTILILIDGFLQYLYFNGIIQAGFVTILILIDGFLQYV